MARISTYPLDTGIVATDKLLGSDENDLSTKNFQVSDLTTYFNTQILGYSSYTARITDFTVAGGVPTVIVFGNSIGSIVWSWVSQGIWKGVLAGAFTTNKTVIFAQSVVYNNPSIGPNGASGVSEVNEYPTTLITSMADNDTVNITQYELANTGASGKANVLTCDIEIRVYI